MSTRLFLVFAAAVAVAACGPSSGVGPGGDGDGDGSGGNGEPPRCDESLPVQISVIDDPPDLLIVLDRSESMETANKWDIMEESLEDLTEQNQTQIKFGLTMYPSDDDCEADDIDAPVALNNFAKIKNEIEGEGPDGNTPTHLALQTAKRHLDGLPPNPAGRYILLATDGLPNCGGDVNTTRAAIEAMRTAGILSYVIGFGDFGLANPDALNQWAVAGGTTSYYAATSPQTLSQAFAAISGQITTASCVFQLDRRPENVDELKVLVNGDVVPRDPTNGWEYDPTTNTISFRGSACEMVRTGNVQDVHLDYGCGIVE